MSDKPLTVPQYLRKLADEIESNPNIVHTEVNEHVNFDHTTRSVKNVYEISCVTHMQ